MKERVAVTMFDWKKSKPYSDILNASTDES